MFTEKIRSIAIEVFENRMQQNIQNMKTYLFDVCMAESVKTQKMSEKALDEVAEKLTATIDNIGVEQKDRLDSLDNKQATHVKVMEDHAKLLEGWLAVFMQKSGVPISEIKPHKTLDDSLELAALRARVAILEVGVENNAKR